MAALKVRRIDLSANNAAQQLAKLRDQFKLDAEVVSPQSKKLTLTAFGEALPPARAVERICTDDDIHNAVERPPETTRARLRGEFIRRAKERKRDYTVDWVHLKLNDQAQRTVLCKDPFRARDERVEKLIASL